MKKIILLLVILVLVLVGCSSGVPQEEYDAAVSERDVIVIEKENLLTEKSELTEKLDDVLNELDSVKKELASAESSLSEYDGLIQKYKDLSDAEIAQATAAANSQAEVDRVELEKKKKEEADIIAAEAKKAEEERERELKQGYETGITYDQLARTPDEYKGKKVKFQGTVLQVLESSGTTEIRLAINGNYNRVIYAVYSSDVVSSRVLENDYITIYGVSAGLLSYESTSGATITIPSVYIDKIDQ